MKPFITTALVTAFVFSPLAAAQANQLNVGADVRVNDSRGEMRVNIDAKREQFKGNQDERREKWADFRLKLQANAKERVAALSTRIFDKMDASAERMENIAVRIETKIDMFNNEGVNVSEARDLKAQADQKLVIAQKAIADAKISLDAKLQSETSANEVRDLIKSAHNKLKEARQAYVDVVISLKANTKAQ